MATDARAGFSMVEVMVAIIVLAVGVVGLAGTTLYLTRLVTIGDLMTERGAAFQTVVDRIQAMPYNNVTSGTDSVGIYEVTWDAVDAGSQNKIVTVITTGPGLTRGVAPANDPQAVDTFTFRILRR